MPTFRPPTYPVAFPNRGPHWLFNRYWTYPQGYTVVIVDGEVSQIQYPYQGDLEDFDTVYLGGYDHEITSGEADVLTDAGYGDNIT